MGKLQITIIIKNKTLIIAYFHVSTRTRVNRKSNELLSNELTSKEALLIMTYEMTCKS